MSDILNQMIDAFDNIKKRGKYVQPPTIISTGKQLNTEMNTNAFDENNTYIFSSTQDLDRHIKENEK